MTILTRDVTDLPAGTVIPTDALTTGDLTVAATHFTYDDFDQARLVGVAVDVTCDPDTDRWDIFALAEQVGAESAAWLGNTSTRRYRLFYAPDATVTTIDAEAGS